MGLRPWHLHLASLALAGLCPVSRAAPLALPLAPVKTPAPGGPSAGPAPAAAPLCTAALEAVYTGDPVEGFRYYAVIVSVQAASSAPIASNLTLTVANALYVDPAGASGCGLVDALPRADAPYLPATSWDCSLASGSVTGPVQGISSLSGVAFQLTGVWPNTTTGLWPTAQAPLGASPVPATAGTEDAALQPAWVALNGQTCAWGASGAFAPMPAAGSPPPPVSGTMCAASLSGIVREGPVGSANTYQVLFSLVNTGPALSPPFTLSVINPNYTDVSLGCGGVFNASLPAAPDPYLEWFCSTNKTTGVVTGTVLQAPGQASAHLLQGNSFSTAGVGFMISGRYPFNQAETSSDAYSVVTSTSAEDSLAPQQVALNGVNCTMISSLAVLALPAAAALAPSNQSCTASLVGIWGGSASTGNAYHTVLFQLEVPGGALALPGTLAAGNALYTDPVPAGGCTGLEDPDLDSDSAAAWTCGLTSGAITGLISALPGLDSPQDTQNLTYAFSFFLPVDERAGSGPLDFEFSASTSHPLAPDWVTLNGVMCGGIGYLAAALPPSPPAPFSPPSPPSADQVNSTTLMGGDHNIVATFVITGTDLWPFGADQAVAFSQALAAVLSSEGITFEDVTFLNATLISPSAGSRRRHLLQGGALQHTVEASFYVETPSNATATENIAGQIAAVTSNGVLTTQLISQGGYTWVPQLQSVTATTQAPPSKGYLIVANKCSHKFGRWCLDGSGLNKGGIAGIIVAGVVVLVGSAVLMWLLVTTLRRWDTPDPVARAAEVARLKALEAKHRAQAEGTDDNVERQARLRAATHAVRAAVSMAANSRAGTYMKASFKRRKSQEQTEEDAAALAGLAEAQDSGEGSLLGRVQSLRSSPAASRSPPRGAQDREDARAKGDTPAKRPPESSETSGRAGLISAQPASDLRSMPASPFAAVAPAVPAGKAPASPEKLGQRQQRSQQQGTAPQAAAQAPSAQDEGADRDGLISHPVSDEDDDDGHLLRQQRQAGERAVSPAGSRTPSEVRLKIEAFESLARKREAQTRAA